MGGGSWNGSLRNYAGKMFGATIRPGGITRGMWAIILRIGFLTPGPRTISRISYYPFYEKYYFGSNYYLLFLV